MICSRPTKRDSVGDDVLPGVVILPTVVAAAGGAPAEFGVAAEVPADADASDGEAAGGVRDVEAGSEESFPPERGSAGDASFFGSTAVPAPAASDDTFLGSSAAGSTPPEPSAFSALEGGFFVSVPSTTSFQWLTKFFASVRTSSSAFAAAGVPAFVPELANLRKPPTVRPIEHESRSLTVKGSFVTRLRSARSIATFDSAFAFDSHASSVAGNPAATRSFRTTALVFCRTFSSTERPSSVFSPLASLTKSAAASGDARTPPVPSSSTV
mmetsp:Transcript_9784/g.22143  ORF Transcript_9784/g.22143 Transcript_9784/m.22143 type:complete len:269 (+) Transcript_9784:1101-1907(+)